MGKQKWSPISQGQNSAAVSLCRSLNFRGLCAVAVCIPHVLECFSGSVLPSIHNYALRGVMCNYILMLHLHEIGAVSPGKCWFLSLHVCGIPTTADRLELLASRASL